MRMITHSYDSYNHAVAVVNALEAAGVLHNDISLVSGDRDRSVSTTVTGDTAENTTAATGTGASIGTVLGGGAGLLAGLGALAIPGVGPVVAAGWLIATLTGAGVGAAAGGLLGSLTSAGVDAADAKTYADHVGRGGTLVTVRADDARAPQIEYILEHGQARTASAAMTAPVVVVPVASTLGTRMTTSGVSDKIDPLDEQARLRGQRVTLDRRPINRPLTGAAGDAFRERPIATTASSEEA